MGFKLVTYFLNKYYLGYFILLFRYSDSYIKYVFDKNPGIRLKIFDKVTKFRVELKIYREI